MSISPDLLKILVCPLGKSELRLEGEKLICKECGTTFFIKDGIPDMLIEDAELPPGCNSVEELPCVKAGKARLIR